MSTIGRVLAGFFLLIPLTACGADDGGDGSGVEGIEAKWSTVAMPAEALAPTPVHQFTDSIAATDGLPMLRVGAVAEPGKPPKAVVWASDAVHGVGQATPLKVGGDESYAVSVATDGALTAISGTTWDHGTGRPFVLTSKDRTTWKKAATPAKFSDRGVVGTQVVVADGAVLAFGVDDDNKPVVAHLTDDEVVDLPTAKSVEVVNAVAGAAVNGKSIVVLFAVSGEDGAAGVLPVRSSDSGKTWKAGALLKGSPAHVAGVVAVADRFVATGTVSSGSISIGAAWSSADGGDWTVESIARYPNYVPGWSTTLGDPAVHNGEVFVGYDDEEKLSAGILRRSSDGTWSFAAMGAQWISPDETVSVESDGPRGVQVLREWNGNTLVLALGSDGKLAPLAPLPSSSRPITWWDSVGVSGTTPVLVGGRQVVSVEDRGSWNRTSQITPFAISGGTMAAIAWDPPAPANTTGAITVTANNGDAVTLFDRYFPSDDRNVTDEAGPAAWFRAAGSDTWIETSGLNGPRTEFVSDLEWHAKTWVAAGEDRRSSTGSDRSVGAIWTSTDGQTWTREAGPHGETEGDSWMSDSCTLPSGDLLVVGGEEDYSVGQRALAVRRVGTTWKQLNVEGLGRGVSLDSCASTGDVTLLQGTKDGRDKLWATEDGKEFTNVPVGGDQDSLGEIQAMKGGFAGPGQVNAGNRSQPVVWLSRDGRKWYAVDAPGDRSISADSVVTWGKRLLVAGLGVSGPGVAVLSNPAELLEAAEAG